jgi:thiamine kinase-like enzyme
MDPLKLIAGCKALHIPGFDTINENGNGVTVTPLAGGLSNTLYVISVDNVEKTKIVSRLSAHTELPPGSCLLDQYQLMNALPLSLAPRAFGCVDICGHSVSFESFVESHGVLTGTAFRTLEFASEIGIALGKMHRSNSISSFTTPSTLRSRLEMITKIAGTNFVEEANALLPISDGISDSDKEFTSKIFQSQGCCGDSLIIHADSLPGNFLIHKQDESPSVQPYLSLLDFEYSISAPLIEAIGYEIGNAMCEFLYEYDEKDPPGFSKVCESSTYFNSWCNALVNGWARTIAGKSGTYECEVLERVAHAASRKGILQSHLFWASWSFILDNRKQAATVFDYGVFSKERLCRLKEAYNLK